MWKSLPRSIACATACTKDSPAIVSCATSGFTPTISGRASVSMNASMCPVVERERSPRGSLGLASSANYRSDSLSTAYSQRKSMASRMCATAVRGSRHASASVPSRPPQKT